MWWRIGKVDKLLAHYFVTAISQQRFCNNDFATRCNLALRRFNAAAKHVTHSGHRPTTITADFALGKTVS
jgi:hypothetical protein